MTNANHYQHKLKLSESEKVQRWWDTQYHQRFHNISAITRNSKDGLGQRSGIDTVILLATGKMILIDEKNISRFHPDILIEYNSGRAKGWIEKQLVIDYIAYGYLDSNIMFLLPWDLLQQAWYRNKNQWILEYPTIEAKNVGYITKSLAMPISVIGDAIQKEIFGL